MKAAANESTRGAGIGLIAIAVVAVIFVAVAWFMHTFHKVEREVDLPMRGEASYNPLYALKQTLQADGITVEARQRLNLASADLGVHDTVLLYSDPRSLSPPEVERLLTWVKAGGHLLVRSPEGSDANKEDLEVALYDALGAYNKGEESERRCLAYQVSGEKQHVEFCRGQRVGFYADTVPELAWGDLKNGYAYARLALGKGHVDIVSDFAFLTNGRRGAFAGRVKMPAAGNGESLRDATHQNLTRQILAPNYGQGVMHLVYAARLPSFWRQLFTQGWMVWLPLLLALMAWLWLRMQRFGPLQPDPVPERRSLLEHIRASGDLLLRYGKGPMLYGAVRQAFLVRLRRTDPLAAALTGDVQAHAIAQRLNVSPDLVRQALQVPASHDKLAFRDRISLLIKLRNQL